MALPEIRGTSAPTTIATRVTTYSAVGLAEDIRDIVSILSPADTPFYSGIRDTPAEAVVVSWQMDALRNPAVNAKIEGADATVSAQAVTGMLSNWTQLFEEYAAVSSSVLASRPIGRANEMEYQIMKRSKEIKRDIERALVGINQAVVTGNASTARKMASLSGMLAAGAKFGNAAAGAAAAGYGPVAIDRDATDTRAFSEVILLGAHRTMYANGAEPNWLLVNAVDAGKVANFAYVSPIAGSEYNESNRGRVAGEGTLYNKVETYISPYGTLSVIIDRFVSGSPNTTIEDDGAPAAGDGYAFLINTDQCFTATLQPFSATPLAVVGHSERQMVSTECTLGVENNLSCGVIGDLTIV